MFTSQETQLKASDIALEALREEYRTYKARAHSLFTQKAIDVNQGKIQEMEDRLKTAAKEKRYGLYVSPAPISVQRDV